MLLILLGALGATTLVLRAGDRIEVVKVTKDIQAGESVNDSNTTSVMVAADDSIHYVKWSQQSLLKKLKAKSTIYAGSVVVGEMFAEGSDLPSGKASVGVSLKEGQYPVDIKAGDTVAVYNVDTGSSSSDKSGATSTSSGGLIVDGAKVNKVSDGGDATISTGNLSLTLLVNQSDAAAVARAASAGAVAIVHVPGNGNGNNNGNSTGNGN